MNEYTSGEFHAGYQKALEDVLGCISERCQYFAMDDIEEGYLRACFDIELDVEDLEGISKDPQSNYKEDAE